MLIISVANAVVTPCGIGSLELVSGSYPMAILQLMIIWNILDSLFFGFIGV